MTMYTASSNTIEDKRNPPATVAIYGNGRMSLTLRKDIVPEKLWNSHLSVIPLNSTQWRITATENGTLHLGKGDKPEYFRMQTTSVETGSTIFGATNSTVSLDGDDLIITCFKTNRKPLVKRNYWRFKSSPDNSQKQTAAETSLQKQTTTATFSPALSKGYNEADLLTILQFIETVETETNYRLTKSDNGEWEWAAKPIRLERSK